jgi:SPASM domain peptide maturase of grasp-with-spasm system
MLSIDFSHHSNDFFYLFADCYPVKGYTRSMVCDVSRKKGYFIENIYYDLLTELGKHPIGEVLDMLASEEDHVEFNKFLNYLLDNDIGTIVDDLSVFPPINIEWDHPSIITNSIIDLRNDLPDFNEIFSQLEDLNCRFIQLRFFECISLDKLIEILWITEKKNFQCLQILLKYESEITTIKKLKKITYKYPIATLTVYDTPENYLDKIKGKGTNRVLFLNQQIQSKDHCGIINLKSLHFAALKGFMENTIYNGCLNRKISIDEKGEIRNCPSTSNSYGNVKDTTLKSVVDNPQFRDLWSVTKDQIKICEVCEYRRLCTDCRAYLQDPFDKYSKPLKCGYDPYTGLWEKWTTNHLSQKGMIHYGFTEKS